MGETIEKIEDVEELRQVQRQAQRVRVKGFLAGVAMTLLALLIPYMW